ncbi:MAG: SBBP repeat-containing protein, partial [Acidobacteriota bacterium]
MLGAIGLSTSDHLGAISNYKSKVRPNHPSSAVPPLSPASIAGPFEQIPLGFEENRGQTNGEVRFLARANGYNVFLTDHEAVLAFSGNGRPGALRLGLTGRSKSVRPRPLEELPGRTNYLRQRHEGQTGIRSFGRVAYDDVYPGIDQVFYGNQRRLEYDLVVEPGSDPRQIGLRIEGAKHLQLSGAGDLVLALGDEELRMSRPVAWQEIDGRREAVDCRYVQTGPAEVGLQLGDYDPRHRLVIDPVIQYSTYLGGGAGDAVIDLAVDGEGNTYLTGWTYSIDYPVRSGGLQINHPGASTAVFVTKLNPTGTALVYSTYLGPVDSKGQSIAVDKTGQVYLTGSTSSPNFPTTDGAMQPQPIGLPEWAFVTKLNETGSQLVYSTYLTGLSATTTTTIAVDSSGAALVAGNAGDGFPTTPEAFQPRFKGGATDGFVARLDPAGATFEYATYLGGSDFDTIRSIAVDETGQVYVTGVTTRQIKPSSTDPSTGIEPQDQIPFSDFPVTRGAFQTVPRGRSDVFVTKIKSDGAALIYSTLLGGTGEEMAVSNLTSDEPELGRSLAIDAIGNVYVTGTTLSNDFPTTIGSYQRTLLGTADLFITKLNVAGTRLLYSTYLGGGNRDVAGAIAIDADGSAFLTGWTLSSNFPLTVDGLRRKTPESSGIPTAFVTQLDKAGAVLQYSTYLGGSAGEQGTCLAVSQAGSTYVGGFTNSGDFPTTPRSYRPQLAGQQDGFVVRFVPG